MPSATLVRPLFDGPIDIIGDVHGEIEALKKLLSRLGYDEHGHHSRGRRLVFVGDLTDRGPDSPGVVAEVQRLVEAGRAQCVLGNHEFNILAERLKPENSWLFDEAPPLHQDGVEVPQKRAGPAERESICTFFAELPVALERPDLRIVHACWNDAMIALLRQEHNVLDVYRRHEASIDARLTSDLSAVEIALAHQNCNPIKLLTSGPEAGTTQAWELNGKLRYEVRVAWWRDYRANPFVVFGHYWRTPLPDEKPVERLFEGYAPHEALGPVAMCIDYSVGKRFRERRPTGVDQRYVTQLAALRWPERELVFDNEERPVPLEMRRAP
jgi:hypothetical protein